MWYYFSYQLSPRMAETRGAVKETKWDSLWGRAAFPWLCPLKQRRHRMCRTRVEAEMATACPVTLVLREASFLEAYQNSRTVLLFPELDGKDSCYPWESFPLLEGCSRKWHPQPLQKALLCALLHKRARASTQQAHFFLFVFFIFTVTMWLSVLLFWKRKRKKKKKEKII